MLRITLALSCLLVIAACGAFTERGAAATHRVYTHDFITATKIVGRYYGSNVKYWLQNCSSSEGGHGGFVWYNHDSKPRYGYTRTPGGWMQFMGQTFYDNLRWAFNDARRRGLHASSKAKSYYEPLGQAIVAGVMYHYYGNPGTWTGRLC